MNKNRVILITGTSRGIGKYLVEYYVKRNLQVIGCSRTQIKYSYKNYKHFCLDISNETDVKKLFCELYRIYKRLDILINNAGAISMNYALLTPLAVLKEVLDSNFIGTFLFCREAVKLMQVNRYGRVINISSIAVPLSSAGSSIYSSAKAAVEQFSKVLAKEIISYGITVNTLGLSFVKNSGMVEKISEKTIKESLERTISKSWLNIKDITYALDFLISPRASTITSQTLYLGGV